MTQLLNPFLVKPVPGSEDTDNGKLNLETVIQILSSYRTNNSKYSEILKLLERAHKSETSCTSYKH
jgi:hypothetical protein